MGLFKTLGKIGKSVLPLAAPLIGGFTSGGISSALSAGASLLGGAAGNKNSAKEAQKNRDFQERMSSTAHQREVDDLRAAGLNPILSANSGSSTPGGATSVQHDPVTPSVMASLQASTAKAQIAKLQQETLNAKVQQGVIQNLSTTSGYDALVARLKSEVLGNVEKGVRKNTAPGFTWIEELVRKNSQSSAKSVEKSDDSPGFFQGLFDKSKNKSKSEREKQDAWLKAHPGKTKKDYFFRSK